jgi:hypothetical protein
MTNKQFAILIAILLVTVAIIAVAQNPTLTPYQFSVNNVTHASCTVVAATTQYCYASDGPYVSINGAAYVSMLPGAPAAGVTTFNGRTGAVTLTDADVTATGLKVITTVTSTATSTAQ